MKIEHVPIDEIYPYENNPRLNRKTINKLKELLSTGGVDFNVPLLLDRDNVIVKGHARHQALKELGWETAPVIYSDNSDELNNEDRLQDNIIQELSTWKEDELSIELRDTGIEPAEYDIKLTDIGYKTPEASDVTEDDVKSAVDRLSGIAGSDDTEFIELICPFCGEEFMISKDDVKSYD